MESGNTNTHKNEMTMFSSVVLTCASYENNFITSLALAGLAQPIRGKVSWISLVSSIIKKIVVLY